MVPASKDMLSCLFKKKKKSIFLLQQWFIAPQHLVFCEQTVEEVKICFCLFPPLRGTWLYEWNWAQMEMLSWEYCYSWLFPFSPLSNWLRVAFTLSSQPLRDIFYGSGDPTGSPTVEVNDGGSTWWRANCCGNPMSGQQLAGPRMNGGNACHLELCMRWRRKATLCFYSQRRRVPLCNNLPQFEPKRDRVSSKSSRWFKADKYSAINIIEIIAKMHLIE